MNTLGNFFKYLVIAFFTGFTISIPLGPSGIESVNRSISLGFREGLKVSIGAILADMTYLLIINLGLMNFLNSSNKCKGLFWIISGTILTIFNLYSKKNKNKIKNMNFSKSNGLMSGYIITLLNPMTPSLWLALSGTVLHSWYDEGKIIFLMCLVLLMLGSLSWFTILNLLATKGFKFFNKNVKKKTSSILDYVLLFLGIAFIILGLINILEEFI